MILGPGSSLKTASYKWINGVLSLMTPLEVLAQTEFPTPRVITPETVPDLATLFTLRDDVRTLKLLPVKTHEVHELYNSQRDDPKLVEEINAYLGGQHSTIATNRFPYQLPPGIEQYLVWTRLEIRDNVVLAKFMANCLTTMNLTPNDLILFERSLQTSAKLIRGTFRAVRHVHFWVRT